MREVVFESVRPLFVVQEGVGFWFGVLGGDGWVELCGFDVFEDGVVEAERLQLLRPGSRFRVVRVG